MGWQETGAPHASGHSTWSWHRASLGPPGIITACALSCLCHPLSLPNPNPYLSVSNLCKACSIHLSPPTPSSEMLTVSPWQNPSLWTALPLGLPLNSHSSSGAFSFLLEHSSSSLRTHRFEPVSSDCSPHSCPCRSCPLSLLPLPRLVHRLPSTARVMIHGDFSSHVDDLPGLCPFTFLRCFPLVTLSSIQHQPLVAVVML